MPRRHDRVAAVAIRIALLAVLLAVVAACKASPSAHETVRALPSAAPSASHDELHLPPAGPQVTVVLQGKQAEVVLANVGHDGSPKSLVDVWKVAFPAEDAAPLHFDLVGSDGFRPGSRPACSRLLTGAELAAARIDVGTHDVSFDDSLGLPRCYRVKGVVRVEATR